VETKKNLTSSLSPSQSSTTLKARQDVAKVLLSDQSLKFFFL